MTRSEILAHNTGVAAVAALAAASADAMRLRLIRKPTRYSFAIAALEAIVEASADMRLPMPPDGTEPAASTVPASPRPPQPTDGVAKLAEVS